MTIEPLTQDSCAFYDDVGVYADYPGVVLDSKEGARMSRALGPHKAVILRNQGIVAVGESADSAGRPVWGPPRSGSTRSRPRPPADRSGSCSPIWERTAGTTRTSSPGQSSPGRLIKF